MRKILSASRKLIGGATLLATAWLAAAPSLGADSDKGVLADLISKALSSPTTQVSIGAVDGALSSDATISDIVLSDRNGPWLKLDKARLVWNRLALFKRRLEVDQLEIGKLEILRKPLPAPVDPNAPKIDYASILPDLPLKVIIKQFGVSNLSLGEPIVGTAAQLGIAGAATLGPPSEGLDMHLDAHRLDAAGSFAAKLGFIPASKTLTLALKFDEPAGGLLARLANIPGLPPVKFSLDGAGPLDSFAANMVFDAGPTIGASGQINLNRNGPGRRLTIDLKSQIEGLMPPLAGAVFAGQTALNGDIFLGDDSSVKIDKFNLASKNAALDFNGGVNADQNLDLSIHAGAIPNADNHGPTGVGKLDLHATVKGPAAGPRIDAQFDAAQLRSPQGQLGDVAATFVAKPNGLLSDAATKIALAADVKADGLALADAALNKALGQTLTLTLRANAALDGATQIDAFHLTTQSVSADYTGLAGPKAVHGKLSLQAPDLSRFAEIANVALKGAADIAADLDGAPDKGAFTAALDAKVNDFATGVAAADGFAGGRLGLTGAAQTLPNGGFGFQNLVLTGAHGQMQIDGAATEQKASVNAQIDVPEIHFLDPHATGKARIVAALTGALHHLDGDVKLTLDEGRLMDRPTQGLALEAKARDITGLIDSETTLAGAIDQKPLDADFHIAKQADGGWFADRLRLDLGSAHLNGGVKLDARFFANGALAFNTDNLDDLSPLALTKLGGAIKSQIELTAADNKQNAALTAHSARLDIGANHVEGLDANLTLSDVRSRPIADGMINVAKALAGGQTIADMRLKAKGATDGSDLDLSGQFRAIALKSQARLVVDPPMRLELANLSAQGNGQRLALAGPATLTLADGGIDVKGLALTSGGGRLTLDGRVGATLDAKLAVKALPLAVANIAAPGLGLTGTMDADAALAGTPGEPAGDWRLALNRLTAPQSRDAGLAAIDLRGTGRLGGGRTTLDVSINAGPAGNLRLTGSAPLSSAGDLDIKAQGKLEAAAANGMLAASGRRVTGEAIIDAQLRGPASKPQAQGSVVMTNGGFTDAEAGVKLEKIDAKISGRGDQITIDRINATTPNGGALNVAGQVRLDAGAGFPGTIRITGQKAQLISNEIVSASADLALDLTGALAQDPHVSGRIGITSMDISVPDRLPGNLRPIDGTIHVKPGATAKARLAMDAKAKNAAKRAPPFNAKLALTISAPNRIFVRGRGIDAELSGDLKVAGTSANPQISGGFDLRRGTLSLVGKQLDFTQGSAKFHGDTMPELNFIAQTVAGDVTANIEVTGPANQPVFAFTSQPSLPQDEILSRVLFEKPSGSLSPFHALELANTASTLSGGSDNFEKMRKTLGVDSLDVGTDANGNPMLGAKKAISDRISIGVNTGSKPEDNGVSVDLDITRHIRLQSGVDATGGSNAGIGAQWEYGKPGEAAH
ncbi:translocation/assembly module TamB domain-containing protein [Methylocapsa sp. S129]|uniref:translocation/assembly module TamB domain-containing protein n=1 Tax=Methylocapsa sp. S129 TaxID=1641869 RepID=UPI00131D23CD|nr:translocation/assembly module TamB domain-containing protein [Methylocapsa sp. S129]